MKYVKKWMVVPYQPKIQDNKEKNIKNISANNLSSDYDKLKLYNHYLALNNQSGKNEKLNYKSDNEDIETNNILDTDNVINDQSIMEVDKTVMINKPEIDYSKVLLDEMKNQVNKIKSLNNDLAKNKINNQKILKKLMESSFVKAAPGESTRKKMKNKRKSLLNLSLSKLKAPKENNQNKDDQKEYDDDINEISSMLNTAYNETANESTMGRLFLDETKNTTDINNSNVSKNWTQYRK